MRTLPKEIGPYQSLLLLGDGGTGVVMRGLHCESGALAAIKIPKHPRLEDRVVLRREIGVLQRLSRTGIRGVVSIVEHGEFDGGPWYAMELVQGQSLSLWLTSLWQGRALTAPCNRGDTLDLGELSGSLRVDAPSSDRSPRPQTELPLPLAGAGQLERVLQLSLRIAETVAQLHSEGVVHGDITPRNILLRDEGDPALIDFGTALMADTSEPYRESSLASDTIRGTPGYLAPETLDGEAPDMRSDLYSLGVILYELLAGTPPFAAASIRDVLSRQTSGATVPLSRLVSGVPIAVERTIERLLAKDPAARLAYVDEVCRVLCASLEQPPRILRSLSPHHVLLRSRVHGRSEALDLVDRRLAEAKLGRGGLIVISGGSGLGKTRLLREARRRASRAAVRVFAAEANPALRLSANSEVKAPGFALLDSALRSVVGEEATKMANETQGVAMRSAFVALERAAGTEPMLILLDDVDHADELSLAFLQRYAKELATTRMLVVATVTAEPHDQNALLTDVATRVSLSPLSHGESRSMVRDLLGAQQLPDGLLEFLQRHADGNPLFLAEYTRALLSRGILSRQARDWAFAAADRGGEINFELPRSIEDLFELRLGYLSMAARQAATKASVHSHSFDIAAFRAITGAEADATELLEELVARDVLDAGADGRYRFAHEKLRESLETSLAAEERAALHRHVALREESLGNASIVDEAVLGYHWAKAGESARAVDYLEVAAQQALAQHAPERAAELLRMAVTHGARLEDSPDKPERVARLDEAFADVLFKRARHREARDRLDLVLASSSAPLRRARLLRKHATSCCTLHEYSKAAEYSERAERVLELGASERSEEVWRELIQIRLGRFDQLYFSGKLGAELDQLVEELAPLIETHGTADQACTYYFMATSHAFLRSRYAFDERALVFAENGLRSAMASMTDRRGMAEFILGGALLLGSRDQCTRALGHFEHAAALAVRSGDATLVSRVRTYQAVARLRLGDVEGVSVAANLALDAAETAGLGPYIAAAEACQGWVASRRGDVSAALTLLRAARARWKAHPHRFPFSNLAIFPLIDIACASDDFESAEPLLRELLQGLPAMPEPLTAATQAALAAIQQAEPRLASKALTAVLCLARECALT